MKGYQRVVLLSHLEVPMEPCDHVGFHTGQGRYDRMAERLRYVLVRDDGEAEVRELVELGYRPQFAPRGLPEAA